MRFPRALLALWLSLPAAAVETSVPRIDLPRLPAASVPALPAAALPSQPQASAIPVPPRTPTAMAQAQGLGGAAAKPESTAAAARLGEFFDASKAPASAANLVAEPPAPGPLVERAKPWRTQNQLSKLGGQPPRGPGERFTFSVIGDAEPGRFWIWRALFNHGGVFAKLLAAMDKTQADFIVQLGDMVSRGSAKNYRKFFDLLAKVRPLKPYLTVIGNHDRRKPHGVTDSKMYRALFGPTDYTFDRGGVRFVVLDSSAGRVAPEQLAWLDKTLDTPLRKVVLTHMPPTALKAWTKVPHIPMAGGFKKGSHEFTDIVSRRGVERVYTGHVHAFGYLDHKGVRYVLTGGGGSPLFPSNVQDRFHHFLTVEVSPDGLVETVHKEDGTAFRIPAPSGR